MRMKDTYKQFIYGEIEKLGLFSLKRRELRHDNIMQSNEQ